MTILVLKRFSNFRKPLNGKAIMSIVDFDRFPIELALNAEKNVAFYTDKNLIKPS